MIDIRILRENPKIFYESCEKRGFGREIVDRVIDIDTSWRSMLKQVNEKKHLKNELSLKIADLAKKKEDSSEIRNDVKRINSEILTLEERMKALEKERESLLLQVPNVLHDTVPVCKGDENNKLVRYFGKAKVFSEDLEYFLSNSGNSSDYNVLSKRPESHVDLMEKLKIADLESAARISGSRFYFLKNRLLKLELALVNYAVDFL
ncbi:MAG: serine--tRNA ligase, partial [Candidatus Thermoplasmatota archaeon]|nr:serine--tRNA ligase [Candidatus Thermoplasmatota archaeon]